MLDGRSFRKEKSVTFARGLTCVMVGMEGWGLTHGEDECEYL